jgi:hypothetical protein
MVKFSVIIPTTGGREELLRLALVALDMQTFPKEHFEVIVPCDAFLPEKAAAAEEVCEAAPFPVQFLGCPKPRELWEAKTDLSGRTRNVGARVAQYGHFVFLDSEVLLCPQGLALYAEDFTDMSNRLVAGLYHWLPPMVVTEGDVRYRFDDVLEVKLPAIPLAGPPQHNIGRDGREPYFQKCGYARRWTAYNRFLACLTGNLGVPRKIYEDVGGFREDLPDGIDGAFGLEAYRAGYTCSYDYRIVGGHLYHPRNLVDPEMRRDEMIAALVRDYHSDDSWMGRQLTLGDY